MSSQNNYNHSQWKFTDSAIEFEIFDTCWHPEIIQEKINNKEFIYWIYKSNVEIVAYLAVQRIDKEFHIIGIGVKEGHRNKQIATKLMDTLLQFFSEIEKKFDENAEMSVDFVDWKDELWIWFLCL